MSTNENDTLIKDINGLLARFNELTDETQEKIKNNFKTQIESNNTNELVKLKTSLTKTITALEEAAKEPVAPVVVEEPVAPVVVEEQVAPVVVEEPVVVGAQEGGSRRRKSKKSKGRKTKKGKKRKTRRKGKKSSKRRK